MRSLLCLPLLAASLAAQNFIVPSRLSDLPGTSTATAPGETIDAWSFRYSAAAVHPVRVQHLWPVTDIPVPAAFLHRMGFRRPNWLLNYVTPFATATFSVDLSVGPRTVAGRSTTFAANHGAIVTRVFNGSVNLPATNPGTGAAPFLVTMPFTQSFAYAAGLGNTLVADVLITSYTSPSNVDWWIDAVGTDAGRRTDNGAFNDTCVFANGSWPQGRAPASAVLGGELRIEYRSGNTTPIPAGLVGIGLLGFIGAGGNWSGIALPFALPGAPNCVLSTSIALAVPLTELSGRYHWPPLPIPNDPRLYDASFFEQGLFDQGANPLGVVTSLSGRWTIRSGQLPLGGKIYQYMNQGTPFPGPTTGYSEAVATIAQFAY